MIIVVVTHTSEPQSVRVIGAACFRIRRAGDVVEPHEAHVVADVEKSTTVGRSNLLTSHFVSHFAPRDGISDTVILSVSLIHQPAVPLAVAVLGARLTIKQHSVAPLVPACWPVSVRGSSS